MSPSPEETIAIEEGLEALASALKSGEIAPIAELLTESTVVMAPAKPTAKGRILPEFLRRVAANNDGIQLQSRTIDKLGEGVIQDIGTLSMRPRQKSEQRIAYRYMMIWAQSGSTWKLATMVWNRGAPARRAAAARQAAAQAGS